jgi:glucose/arabinose dehydrogenase
MKKTWLLVPLVAVALPAGAVVQLTQVASSLSYPTLCASAADGSGRLFFLEKAGVIKVLAPGSANPTVFLDIHLKVLGPPPPSEQGLLGLAFHPGYPADPRFYVYYTPNEASSADYVEQISEFRVSLDPLVALTDEKPILTIPHPTNTNHNGGMMAFGPDGYLYLGVGDGGSANDPPNNAQNKNVLLGKLLRIDVDHPNGDVPYSSPSDNPFYGATPGADEIFAYGLRNPWRFSFDRGTGDLWVGDVGQGAREEVDTPIVKGGNYGWSVFEGNQCTGLYPSLCNTPSNYIFPVLDYAHTGGRCAITGGYVYRGTASVFPQGTYLYADYCTGEIFSWDGAMSALVLDTTLTLSSFGEDEAGELYAVGLGQGTVSRLTTAGCSYSVSPTSIWSGDGATSPVVQVTASNGCAWRSVSNASWVSVTAGATGTGNGATTLSISALSPPGRIGSVSVAGRLVTVHQFSVDDVFVLINYLFASGPLPPFIRDANADGKVDVVDVFALVNFLFAGGSLP